MRIGVLLTMVLLGTAAAGTSRAENRMSWGQLKSGGPEASVDAEGVSLHVAQTAVRVARFHSPIPLRGAVKVRSLEEAGYPGAFGVAAVGESGMLLAFVIAPDGTLEGAWSYEPANGVLRDLRNGKEIPVEELLPDGGETLGSGAEAKGGGLTCTRIWRFVKSGTKVTGRFNKAAWAVYVAMVIFEQCAGDESETQDAGGSSPDTSGANPDTTGTPPAPGGN